jgi:hypothetical protein
MIHWLLFRDEWSHQDALVREAEKNPLALPLTFPFVGWRRLKFGQRPWLPKKLSSP